MEIGKLGRMQVISEKQTLATLDGDTCLDVHCALEIGKKLDADRIALFNLLTLGEKVIVRYLLLDVATEKILLDEKSTASYLEDLDTVMARIAKSMVGVVPMNETAEVGAITAHESEIPLRRGARPFAGFSFGYLYPQNGYDNVDRSFTVDFRTGAEFTKYDVGMQLAIRKGFAMNVFSSYLGNRKDFCPYVGGAFGFHWVKHDYYYYDYYSEYDYSENHEKKGDGFELTLNWGIRGFHTYNFQILVNFAYSFTFNDYDDRALVFTIGLLR